MTGKLQGLLDYYRQGADAVKAEATAKSRATATLHATIPPPVVTVTGNLSEALKGQLR